MPDHTGQNIQVFKDQRDPSGQVLRDIKGNLCIPKSEWEAAFASNPTQAQMAWTNWQIERGNNDMRWEGRVRDAAQTGLTAAKERVHTSLKQIPGGFFEHPDTQAILREAEAEVNKLTPEQRASNPDVYAAAATLLLAKDDMAPMKKIVSELLAKGQTVAQAQATQNRTVIASSAGAPTAPSAPPAPAGNHGLDADELEMARRFNMTPEKYAQNKVIQRIGR